MMAAPLGRDANCPTSGPPSLRPSDTRSRAPAHSLSAHMTNPVADREFVSALGEGNVLEEGAGNRSARISGGRVAQWRQPWVPCAR